MKNMNKLFVGLLLAFGLLAVRAEASVGERSPQTAISFGYTSAISSVTAFTVTESTTVSPFIMRKPGAVYQMVLSTAASGEYCILYDTTTATGLTTPAASVGASNYTAQLGPRIFFGSTSQNTVLTFDPPIIFFNGLMVGCSTTSAGGSITYSLGRGLSGF